MRSFLRCNSSNLISIFLVIFLTGVCVYFVLPPAPKAAELKNPLSDKKFGFQLYEPRFLPANFEVTRRSIDARTRAWDSNEMTSLAATINIRKKNGIYSIWQYRASDEDRMNSVTELRDYDPLSRNATCTERNTRDKAVYRLCHWIAGDGNSVFEVRYIKGNTAIRAEFPRKQSEPLDINSLDRFVDSFEKADPADFPLSINTV